MARAAHERFPPLRRGYPERFAEAEAWLSTQRSGPTNAAEVQPGAAERGPSSAGEWTDAAEEREGQLSGLLAGVFSVLEAAKLVLDPPELPGVMFLTEADHRDNLEEVVALQLQSAQRLLGEEALADLLATAGARAVLGARPAPR